MHACASVAQEAFHVAVMWKQKIVKWEEHNGDFLDRKFELWCYCRLCFIHKSSLPQKTAWANTKKLCLQMCLALCRATQSSHTQSSKCNAPNWVRNAEHPHAGLIYLGFIRGSDALQCKGASCYWPHHSQVVKNVAKASNEPASGTIACVTMQLSMSFGPSHAIGTRFVLDCTTRAIVANKVTTTPILRAEVSFISAERGLSRGILSRTSLKCYTYFSSFWSFKLQFSFANNSKGL